MLRSEIGDFIVIFDLQGPRDEYVHLSHVVAVHNFTLKPGLDPLGGKNIFVVDTLHWNPENTISQ